MLSQNVDELVDYSVWVKEWTAAYSKEKLNLVHIFTICNMLQAAYCSSFVVYSTKYLTGTFLLKSWIMTQKQILISLATAILHYCPTHVFGPSKSHSHGKRCTAG